MQSFFFRNEKLHPKGWIVQCEQPYIPPADILAMFDAFSQALAFVAEDIRSYNLCCTA